MKASLRFLLLVAGFFFAAVPFSRVAADTIDVSRYANLAVGYGWSYQQSQIPGPWTVQVQSVTSKNGYAVFFLQEYDERGDKNDQTFYATDFASALSEVGGLNDYGQPTQQEWFWQLPMQRLMPTFVPGQVYADVVRRTDYPGMDFSRSLVITREAVTVPAGTFADTLKVSESFFNASLGTLSFTNWYANGVGLVKNIQDDGNTWELLSVSGFALPVPLPAPVWLLLSGLGTLYLRFRKRDGLQGGEA